MAADRTLRPPSRRPGNRIISLVAALVLAGVLLGNMALRAGALHTLHRAAGTAPGRPTATTTARAVIVPPVPTRRVPTASRPVPATTTPVERGLATLATATSQPAQAATSMGTPTPTVTAMNSPMPAAPTSTASLPSAPAPTTTVVPPTAPVSLPSQTPLSVPSQTPPSGDRATPQPASRQPTQPAPAPVRYDLQVTLTMAHGVRHFMPLRPTSRFVDGDRVAYVIARWPNAQPGHAVTVQWTAPSGLLGRYSPGCGSACGVMYAEIPLGARGTYHVVFLLDATAIASVDFTAGGARPPAAPTAGPGRASTVPRAAPTGTVAAQIRAAIYYANDVYMQVMNRRDTRHLSAAFGPYLIGVNRAVVAGLQARRQHWHIALVNLHVTGITMLGPDRASVGVTKTERAALYADGGQLISDRGQYTVHVDDLVQRIGTHWIVQAVLAAH